MIALERVLVAALAALAGYALVHLYLLEQADAEARGLAALLDAMHFAAGDYVAVHADALVLCFDVRGHLLGRAPGALGPALHPPWLDASGTARGGEATPWRALALYEAPIGAAGDVTWSGARAECDPVRHGDLIDAGAPVRPDPIVRAGLLPAYLDRQRHAPAGAALEVERVLGHAVVARLFVRAANQRVGAGPPALVLQTLLLVRGLATEAFDPGFAARVLRHSAQAGAGSARFVPGQAASAHYVVRGAGGGWALRLCRAPSVAVAIFPVPSPCPAPGAPGADAVLALDDGVGGPHWFLYVDTADPARGLAPVAGVHPTGSPVAAPRASAFIAYLGSVPLVDPERRVLDGAAFRLAALPDPEPVPGAAADDALLAARLGVGQRMRAELDAGGHGLLNAAFMVGAVPGPGTPGEAAGGRGAGVAFLGPERVDPHCGPRPAGGCAGDPAWLGGVHVVHGNVLVRGSLRVGIRPAVGAPPFDPLDPSSQVPPGFSDGGALRAGHVWVNASAQVGALARDADDAGDSGFARRVVASDPDRPVGSAPGQLLARTRLQVGGDGDLVPAAPCASLDPPCPILGVFGVAQVGDDSGYRLSEGSAAPDGVVWAAHAMGVGGNGGDHLAGAFAGDVAGPGGLIATHALFVDPARPALALGGAARSGHALLAHSAGVGAPPSSAAVSVWHAAQPGHLLVSRVAEVGVGPAGASRGALARPGAEGVLALGHALLAGTARAPASLLARPDSAGLLAARRLGVGARLDAPDSVQAPPGSALVAGDLRVHGAGGLAVAGARRHVFGALDPADPAADRTARWTRPGWVAAAGDAGTWAQRHAVFVKHAGAGAPVLAGFALEGAGGALGVVSAFSARSVSDGGVPARAVAVAGYRVSALAPALVRVVHRAGDRRAHVAGVVGPADSVPVVAARARTGAALGLGAPVIGRAVLALASLDAPVSPARGVPAARVVAARVGAEVIGSAPRRVLGAVDLRSDAAVDVAARSVAGGPSASMLLAPAPGARVVVEASGAAALRAQLDGADPGRPRVLARVAVPSAAPVPALADVTALGGALVGSGDISAHAHGPAVVRLGGEAGAAPRPVRIDALDVDAGAAPAPSRPGAWTGTTTLVRIEGPGVDPHFLVDGDPDHYGRVVRLSALLGRYRVMRTDDDPDPPGPDPYPCAPEDRVALRLVREVHDPEQVRRFPGTLELLRGAGVVGLGRVNGPAYWGAHTYVARGVLDEGHTHFIAALGLTVQPFEVEIPFYYPAPGWHFASGAGGVRPIADGARFRARYRAWLADPSAASIALCRRYP